MNEVFRAIVDEIDHKSTCLQMRFEDSSWRSDISSEPGWYLIKTNTPVKVLQSVGVPKHEAHTNIPRTIAMAEVLLRSGAVIMQTGSKDYVVYNGEALDLKARAREHESGHAKTYCLALSEYELLRNYRWAFCYVAVSECRTISKDDKLLRQAIEQAWRAIHGWPILCRK